MMKIAAAITLILTAIFLLKKGNHPEPTTITGNAMGTTWSLRCDSPEQYRQLIQDNLTEQENLLSHWNPNSELSQLNAGKIKNPSPALQKILTLAQTLKIQTKGAFDHTLLAQTQSAGYAPPLPTTAHTYDLSAIAKGHTIDLITTKLRANGLENFIIELGGECYAAGTQPDGSPWPITIPSPIGEKPTTIHLSNQAIATSGNYYQSQHIIDPSTKSPKNLPPTSITIIAPTCASADAYATALFINPLLPLPKNHIKPTLTPKYPN